MYGQEALNFLDCSLEFTDEVHEATREGINSGITGLKELTEFADETLGPYPDFAVEIGAGVRAHAALLG